MATYNLRRFSKPSALKEMAPENLLELLDEYRDYLRTRGLKLPPLGAPPVFDYEALARILVSPDENLPLKLATGLYFIHEMSTHDGMDALLSLGAESPALMELESEVAPADVALRFWLRDPEALERKHAEMHYLARPRSFESFNSRAWPPPALKDPLKSRLRELEQTLSAWFTKKRRGPSSRVLLFDRDDHIWILIRHGEPLRREGAVEGQDSSSVFYRPEKWDVLIYSRETGELRMNAGSKGERELYRRAIGTHLFGDVSTFTSRDRYSLEPLRKRGKAALVCSDIEGLGRIVLREIWYLWRGPSFEIEIRKSKDIFEGLERTHRQMPKSPPITRAKFEVKFARHKNTRMVTIEAKKTQFKRDEDSILVEEWLQRRGFVIPRETSEDAG